MASASISSHPMFSNRIVSKEEFDSIYKFQQGIGWGSFATVRLAKHKLSGMKVAVKVMSKKTIARERMQERVVKEIRAMEILKGHPNIVRLYEVFETEESVMLVMEYTEGGELYEYITNENYRTHEDEARWLFQQIIAGVEHCHRYMVIHRDLKAENVLLDAKHHIKIADFGLSNTIQQGSFLKTSCGSTNYAAPEVISGKPYGPEVDVWSCGVILYSLLFRSLPFDCESIPALLSRIKAGRFIFPFGSGISADAERLITRMLTVDTRKRITIPEIKQHPWFHLSIPSYLTSPSFYSSVDTDILRRTVDLGFDRDQLLNELNRNETSKGTVTYYIILNNERQISDGFNINEMQVVKGDTQMQQSPVVEGANSNERQTQMHKCNPQVQKS